jgi:hypothetical protein
MYGPTDMGGRNGFDGRQIPQNFGFYAASKSITLPEVATPSTTGHPMTILKAISNESLCNTTDRVCLDYVETLTVLDVPPGDVFRPAYFGTQKVMYPASQFDASVLSNVAPVSGTITWQKASDAVKSVHPQHYVENWNDRQGYTPRVNSQSLKGYDGYSNKVLTQALLKLTEEATGGDVALKLATAKGMTQLGIDLWAIHTEGGWVNPTTGRLNMESVPCGAFIAVGGFNVGRLPVILFANALLGENWHTALNSTFSTPNGRNCFAETGFIQPTSVTSSGKNVPLFGHMIGSHGIYNYTTGTNCNLINDNYLTDGGYPGCGSPTVYQTCCTHGGWLGAAMAIWLTPAVYDNFPANGAHWLEYVDRARSAGVSVGADFGSYSDPNSFKVKGFDSGYDSEMYYSSWDTYRECSKDGSCPGIVASP